MQISRWRSVFPLKTFITPSTAASTPLSAFHSTPCSCQKSNNKSNSNNIRFITRQKRADAKKALKDLLYKGGFSKFSFQDKETVGRNCNLNTNEDGHYNKGQPKFRQRFGKSQKNKRRKSRRQSEDSDDDPETIFQARYGKRYTWSFGGWGWTSENSTSGFEWREQSNWRNSRSRKWEDASDIESDDDSGDAGSCSDRIMLGLPPTGPLKIEDVKNAFRLSALKWHPDKHQGSSQAMAEEKFKLCSNAYKSLCSALSTTKA